MEHNVSTSVQSTIKQNIAYTKMSKTTVTTYIAVYTLIECNCFYNYARKKDCIYAVHLVLHNNIIASESKNHTKLQQYILQYYKMTTT
jgi:hypothetical protein